MSEFRDLHFFPEIDSTNRWLREAAANGDAHHGTVAIADLQTAGRGRLDRRWVAPARSALLMSVLIDAGLVGLDPKRWPLVSFCMALAVCTVSNGMGDLPSRVTLKWPNDVIVPSAVDATEAAGMTGSGYRKLAGILVEASSGRLVVGVGVNLLRPDDIDPSLGVAASAIWLNELTGHPVDRNVFADLVLDAFDANLTQLATSVGDLLDRYRAELSSLGWMVSVEGKAATLIGEAVDIDDLGRLIVVDAKGRHHVDASEVVHVRRA
jgi:BirA family transcriptional regulator, biotin operon repressor / biotin---[acetyl-CoA-carboxylase] ligase